MIRSSKITDLQPGGGNFIGRKCKDGDEMQLTEEWQQLENEDEMLPLINCRTNGMLNGKS